MHLRLDVDDDDAGLAAGPLVASVNWGSIASVHRSETMSCVSNMSFVVLRCSGVSRPGRRSGSARAAVHDVTTRCGRSRAFSRRAVQCRARPKSAGSMDGMICTKPRRAVQRAAGAAAPASNASFSFGMDEAIVFKKPAREDQCICLFSNCGSERDDDA